MAACSGLRLGTQAMGRSGVIVQSAGAGLRVAWPPQTSSNMAGRGEASFTTVLKSLRNLVFFVRRFHAFNAVVFNSKKWFIR